jgi:hypothetical protein
MMFPGPCPKPGAPASRCRQSASRCQGLRQERGSVLFEALIGVILSAVLGLGMAYSAAATLKAQRYANLGSMTVLEMRSLLAAPPSTMSDWCTSGTGTFSLLLNNLTADGEAVSGSANTVSYTLDCAVFAPTVTGASQGAAVSVQRPTKLSTSAQASSLVGGDGKISFQP